MGRPPADRAKVRRAKALRRKGVSLEEIAEAVGLGRTTVHRSVAAIPADARAAANKARAAVAPSWLGQARRLIAGGMTRNEAAATLGVPKSSLYRALDRF